MKKENQNLPNTILMKSIFNLSLFLFTLFIFSDESLSLTNYQIKKFCRKEKKVDSCIENLQKRRSDLQKGKFIEIPVLKYKQ